MLDHAATPAQPLDAGTEAVVLVVGELVVLLMLEVEEVVEGEVEVEVEDGAETDPVIASFAAMSYLSFAIKKKHKLFSLAQKYKYTIDCAASDAP